LLDVLKPFKDLTKRLSTRLPRKPQATGNLARLSSRCLKTTATKHHSSSLPKTGTAIPKCRNLLPPRKLRASSQGKFSKGPPQGKMSHTTWPACFLLRWKMYLIQRLRPRPPLNSSLFSHSPQFLNSFLITLNSSLFPHPIITLNSSILRPSVITLIHSSLNPLGHPSGTHEPNRPACRQAGSTP
jgi:hypothetical protein